MTTEVQTTVCGIPCRARMTYYVPADPGRTYGPPEHCYPPEFEEVDFTILDRRGRPAPWLERKLSDADVDRICTELVEMREAEREPY